MNFEFEFFLTFSIQREKIRPWSEFAEQKSFNAPVGLQQWTKRLLKNVEHYQANYVITFLLLMVYCILTSPLLLIALSVSGIGKEANQLLIINIPPNNASIALPVWICIAPPPICYNAVNAVLLNDLKAGLDPVNFFLT